MTTLNITNKRFDRKSLSFQLYCAAWVVESVAVLIGLAISALTAFTYFDAKGIESSADYLNASVGTLPFVIVAIVEFTKIPMSGAAYYAKNIFWKFIFTVALLFIALITFETMFNGLERFFNAQTLGVVELKKELINLDEKIKDKNSNIDRLKEITLEKIEQEYNQRRTSQTETRDKNIARLQAQRSDKMVDKDEHLLQLRSELADLREEKKFIREDRNDALAQIEDRFNKNNDALLDDLKNDKIGIKKQILEKEKQLSNRRKARDKEASEALPFFRTGVIERHNREIKALSNEAKQLRESLQSISLSKRSSLPTKERKNEIRAEKSKYSLKAEKIDALIRKKAKLISEVVSIRQKDVDKFVAFIDEEIKRINYNFDMQEKENLNVRKNSIEEFHEYESIIAGINKDLDSLDEERTKLRSAINLKAEDTQVYRIAMWWTGNESAADVNKKDVSLTAFIWFGSLSAIAAFTGIILAIASYAVTYEVSEKYPPKWQKLYDVLRRYILFLRKKKRAPTVIKKVIKEQIPVEIIKEVPVEKVVLRDKPIEIIKKEIVHVPMYTNDPKLLGKKS